MTPMLTLPEAAKILRRNRRTVERMIHAGVLPAIQPGGKGGPYLIPQDALQRWVDEQLDQQQRAAQG